MARKRDEGRAAEAARLLASGLGYGEIAERLGADRSTVRRWLGAGSRGRPRSAGISDEQIEAMREDGASYAAIAEQAGVSKSTAWRRAV